MASPHHHGRAGSRARVRAARRVGRLRLAVLVVLLALVASITISQVGSSGSPGGKNRASAGKTGPHSTLSGHSAFPAVEAGLEPWRLNSPLSREVVLPAAGGSSLVVAGGLAQNGTTQSGVYDVDPLNGAARQIGSLASPVHDAAGALVGGKGVIFGGGSASPAALVQQLGALGGSASAGATRLAPLPSPRADDSAAVIGTTAYVLGGYDGSAGDSAVLAMTGKGGYRKVASLPVAVRYAAVAAEGGKLYIFGGDATSGPRSGAPVSTVQVVDPASGSAKVAGALPVPLDGAVAALLGGHLYVAGGETLPSSASPSAAPSATGTIYLWQATSERALVAGHLMTPVSHAGLAVLGSRAWVVGGETAPGTLTSAVQMFEPNARFGVAGQPGAGSPYYGDTLLVADRGNNRLLALNDTGKITWTYPSAGRPAPPGGFYFPDDAFFIHHGTAIISNQEENETVVEIGYPSGKLLWSYGHPRQPGSLPGYLDNPDDAYLLRNGDISIADPMNCRVLLISPSKKILHQTGTPGTCAHQPPKYLGSPNGDTPLPDGNLLVSEINGSFIDEITLYGKVIWSVHLPIAYPSDPQYLGNDRYLVANYERPGAFLEFNRSGKILYQYAPASGTGELNQPSLVESLPSGVLMANDDYNDRIMAIDPATGALVWQYGRTGVAGTAPGLLNTPDGFDLLGPNGTFPTHPTTG